MLYEDEGDNYNYEKGQYATITMTWKDARRTLTIGERKGGYPGMLNARKFTVILPDGTAKTVEYDGKEIEIKL
jgi:alpha-D-xyloside xylohydrolase